MGRINNANWSNLLSINHIVECVLLVYLGGFMISEALILGAFIYISSCALSSGITAKGLANANRVLNRVVALAVFIWLAELIFKHWS